MADAAYLEYIGRDNEVFETDVTRLEAVAGPYFSLFVVTRSERELVMIRVVALTEAGRRLGERLCTSLPAAELYFKPEPFAQTVQQAFRDGEQLVMICATGIVVRTLAPVIANKHDDPPVVVLDEAGALFDSAYCPVTKAGPTNWPRRSPICSVRNWL